MSIIWNRSHIHSHPCIRPGGKRHGIKAIGLRQVLYASTETDRLMVPFAGGGICWARRRTCSVAIGLSSSWSYCIIFIYFDKMNLFSVNKYSTFSELPFLKHHQINHFLFVCTIPDSQNPCNIRWWFKIRVSWPGGSGLQELAQHWSWSGLFLSTFTETRSKCWKKYVSYVSLSSNDLCMSLVD